MAFRCGSWPAFWALGNGPDGVWPRYGEVDLIEFVNDTPNVLMAMHTAPNCTIAGSGQTGTCISSTHGTNTDRRPGKLLTNDCGKDDGFQGCGVAPVQPNNAGTDFNANGGGVYAMEWTSDFIKIWFFPREHIPATIRASKTPDVSTFGTPAANFQGGCDIDTYLSNMSLIFDIDVSTTSSTLFSPLIPRNIS